MQIRFWGTRGSTPSPGPSTVRYGGNTSCVEVQLDDGTTIILDAGSGIRLCGEALGACDAFLLLTHYHWDHIQGMPFFGPAYIPSSNIYIYGPEWNGQGPETLLDQQMVTPYFPAAPAQLRGVRGYATTPQEPFSIGSATVDTTWVCHPNGALGYRIEADGAVMIYMSDNEMDLATPQQRRGMVDLVSGADVLIHDCQFAEREYPNHRGWGHSTPRQAVELAEAGGVRQLVLFHHAPAHSDEEVEAMADEARALTDRVEVLIGREKETLVLEPEVMAQPSAFTARLEA